MNKHTMVYSRALRPHLDDEQESVTVTQQLDKSQGRTFEWKR